MASSHMVQKFHVGGVSCAKGWDQPQRRWSNPAHDCPSGIPHRFFLPLKCFHHPVANPPAPLSADPKAPIQTPLLYLHQFPQPVVSAVNTRFKQLHVLVPWPQQGVAQPRCGARTCLPALYPGEH